MLKLNAAYSKKVPAEGEYTSQSYHAAIDVELPDGLSREQLDERIRATFALVRDSVEAELHRGPQSAEGSDTGSAAKTNTSDRNAAPRANTKSAPASAKQISYLLSLAGKRGITPAELAAKHRVATVAELSRAQVSALIDGWRAA